MHIPWLWTSFVVGPCVCRARVGCAVGIRAVRAEPLGTGLRYPRTRCEADPLRGLMMADYLQQSPKEDPRRNAEREEDVLVSWPAIWCPSRAHCDV